MLTNFDLFNENLDTFRQKMTFSQAKTIFFLNNWYSIELIWNQLTLIADMKWITISIWLVNRDWSLQFHSDSHWCCCRIIQRKGHRRYHVTDMRHWMMTSVMAWWMTLLIDYQLLCPLLTMLTVTVFNLSNHFPSFDSLVH